MVSWDDIVPVILFAWVDASSDGVALFAYLNLCSLNLHKLTILEEAILEEAILEKAIIELNLTLKGSAGFGDF